MPSTSRATRSSSGEPWGLTMGTKCSQCTSRPPRCMVAGRFCHKKSMASRSTLWTRDGATLQISLDRWTRTPTSVLACMCDCAFFLQFNVWLPTVSTRKMCCPCARARRITPQACDGTTKQISLDWWTRTQTSVLAGLRVRLCMP